MHTRLNSSVVEANPNQRKMSKIHTWYTNLTSEDSIVTTRGVEPVSYAQTKVQSIDL